MTDPLPGVDHAPPLAPVEGDSHAGLLASLEGLAGELGYTATPSSTALTGCATC
jgi:hypothetical protein